MAAKKATLDSIAKLIAKTSKSADNKFTALAKDIAEIKQTMATKEQIVALATHVTSIEQELKSIRRDLNDLMEKMENVAGYRKEIDHALERIAAIEKHLGLDKKIAA